MLEIRIKAILVDYLIKSTVEKDFVIATELPFSSGRRKADIIMISKDTCAFEIKSARDNYDRLIDQAKDYVRTFDYSYLIVETPLTKQNMEKLPPRMGVITLNENLEFKKIKTAKRVLRPVKYNLASFLWRDDIVAILTDRHVRYDRQDDIHKLRLRLISKLSTKELRSLANSSLLRRYSSRFNKFLAERGKATHSEDIRILSSPEKAILT